MSLGDCRYCWDNPCTCGYAYRNYSNDKFEKFLYDILRYKGKFGAISILREVISKLEDDVDYDKLQKHK
jgi:hypothetical protein